MLFNIVNATAWQKAWLAKIDRLCLIAKCHDWDAGNGAAPWGPKGRWGRELGYAGLHCFHSLIDIVNHFERAT